MVAWLTGLSIVSLQTVCISLKTLYDSLVNWPINSLTADSVYFFKTLYDSLVNWPINSLTADSVYFFKNFVRLPG